MESTTIKRKGTRGASHGSHPTVANVANLVGEYLLWLDRRDKSPRTQRTYAYVLKHYVDTFGERDISTIDLGEVEAWILRPRNRDVSNVTLRKEAAVVRGFHLWALERGHAAATLRTMQFGKVVRSLPRPVDDDVWRHVWTAPLDDLDRVWLGLGYFAGLRRLEIVSLRPQDVDLANGMLTFQRKGGYYAPVEYAACFSWVQRELPHLVDGHDWVELFDEHAAARKALGANFVWPDSTAGDELDCNRLNKRCDALTRRLGLPPGALTPHRLRHSAATNLLRAGVEPVLIQRQLAHSSFDITQRYLQVSGELARAYHVGVAEKRGRDG